MVNSLSKLKQEFNPFRKYYYWSHRSHQIPFDFNKQLNIPTGKSGKKPSSTINPAMNSGNAFSVTKEWERKTST